MDGGQPAQGGATGGERRTLATATLMLLLLLLAGCAWAAPPYSGVEFQLFEGFWGNWRPWDDPVWPAVGFAVFFEMPCGCDNTAVNGVKLYLAPNHPGGSTTMSSEMGEWGRWSMDHYCGNDAQGRQRYIAGYQVRYQPPQGTSSDDRSVVNLRFFCRSEYESNLQGRWIPDYDTYHFNWEPMLDYVSNHLVSSEMKCSDYGVVTAIQTRIEGNQGRDDDTSLNGIAVACSECNPAVGGYCNEATALCVCPPEYPSASSATCSVHPPPYVSSINVVRLGGEFSTSYTCHYEIYTYGSSVKTASEASVRWAFSDGTGYSGPSPPASYLKPGLAMSCAVRAYDNLGVASSTGDEVVSAPMWVSGIFGFLGRWPPGVFKMQANSRIYLLAAIPPASTSADAQTTCGGMGASVATVFQADAANLGYTLLATRSATALVGLAWNATLSRYVWTAGAAPNEGSLYGAQPPGAAGGKCVAMTSTPSLVEVDCNGGFQWVLCSMRTPVGSFALQSRAYVGTRKTQAEAQAYCKASFNGTALSIRNAAEKAEILAWLTGVSHMGPVLVTVPGLGFRKLTPATESYEAVAQSETLPLLCVADTIVGQVLRDRAQFVEPTASIDSSFVGRFGVEVREFTPPSATLAALSPPQLMEGLSSGTDYLAAIVDKQAKLATGPSVQFRTHCDCDLSPDHNGQPRNFAARQDRNMFYFGWQDYSGCEDTFSLSRDGAEIATITGAMGCNFQLMWPNDAHDDISARAVGAAMTYCVYARGEREYVSRQSCLTKRVEFAGIITGKVTVLSGSPVLGVTVRWSFASAPSECGEVVSAEDGSYRILIQSAVLSHTTETVTIEPYYVKAGARHLFENAVCVGGQATAGSACFGANATFPNRTTTSFAVTHLSPMALDLVDTMSLSIAGVVVFRGSGQYALDAVDCPVIGATVCVASGSDNTCARTDAAGHYSLSAPIGSAVLVFANYSTGAQAHSTMPSNAGLAQVGPRYQLTMSADQTGVDFQISSTNIVYVRLGGGTCKKDVGDGVVTMTALGAPNCKYQREITLSGPMRTAVYVPPMDLRVQLTGMAPSRSVAGVSKPDVLSYLANTLLSESRDQLALLSKNSAVSVEYEYHTDPQLSVRSIGKTPKCGRYWSVKGYRDFIPVNVTVRAWEAYGASGNCSLGGNITLWDGLTDADYVTSHPNTSYARCIPTLSPSGCSVALSSSFSSQDASTAVMSVMPGTPSIVSPYTKTIRVRAERAERTPADRTEEVVITGSYDYSSLFSDEVATVSVPSYMLFDPPGDQSYSKLSKGTLLSSSVGYSRTKQSGTEGEMDILAGTYAESETCVGLGASLCTKVAKNQKVIGAASKDMSMSGTSDAATMASSFELATDVTTSTYPGLASGWGDVVIVNSVTLLKTRALFVAFDTAKCEAAVQMRDAFYPKQAGYSVRTIWDIENVDLPSVRESLSAHMANPVRSFNETLVREWNATNVTLSGGVAMWQGVLDYYRRVTGYTSSSPAVTELNKWRADIACDTDLKGSIAKALPSQANIPACTRANTLAYDTVFFTGGGQTYSMSLTSSTSATLEESSISTLSGSIGGHTTGEFFFTVAAFKFDIKHFASWSTDTSRTQTQENVATVTTEFSLSDQNMGDKFNVKMFINKDFGVPQFQLLNGVSKCPAEESTVSRTGVSLSIWPVVQTNVPESSPAVFTVTVSNTGETREACTYDLAIDDTTNPYGLEVYVNGVPLTSRSVDVAGGASTMLTLVVKRGPSRYSYDGVTLVASTPCEADLEGSGGLFRAAQSSRVSFSVGFQQPCPPVLWAYPFTLSNDPVWTVTSRTTPAERLVVNAQNPRHPLLRWRDHPRLYGITVEYKGPSMASFSAAVVNSTFAPAALAEDSMGFASVALDTTSWTAEGEYVLRIVSRCQSVAGVALPEISQYVAEYKRGLVDRTPPDLFGMFGQPGDGVYWPGDEISLTFVEQLDCNLAFYPVRWTMTVAAGSGAARVLGKEYLQGMCDGAKRNVLQFAFSRRVNLDWLPGTRVTIAVVGVRDVAGNENNAELSWAFDVAAFSTQPITLKVSQFLVGGYSVAAFTYAGSRRRQETTFGQRFCAELMALAGAPVARCQVTKYKETSAPSIDVSFNILPASNESDVSASALFERIRILVEENRTQLAGTVWASSSMNNTQYTFTTTEKTAADSTDRGEGKLVEVVKVVTDRVYRAITFTLVSANVAVIAVGLCAFGLVVLYRRRGKRVAGLVVTGTITLAEENTMHSGGGAQGTSPAARPGVEMLGGEIPLLTFGAARADWGGRDGTGGAWGARGTVLLTSFRLTWSADAERAGADPALSIPLGSVAKICWSGASRSGRRVKVTSKDFSYVKIHFIPEDAVAEIFEAVLQTYAFPGTVTKCFAFCYKPKGAVPASDRDGWGVYDARAELARIGVPDSSWRISEANSQYQVCESYPMLLAVPAGFSDDDIREAAEFRTSGRFPAFCWRHPQTRAAILRSSQPKVGILGSRCRADIELMTQVRQSSSRGSLLPLSIIDARPKVNAVVNKATKGAGAEDVARYERTTLHFMNIENIHVMREAERKLRKSLAKARQRDALVYDASAVQWLSHIRQILHAGNRVAALVIQGASVLVHCSDGWDRTPQIVALAQLILDPFYRTLRGFQVLVEKEWLSFGHKFTDRVAMGHKKDSEYSPIFVQFVDCVYQLLMQFPFSFEFNERFLWTVLREVVDCRHGTFLADTQKMRRDLHLTERTASLWSAINADPQSYVSDVYDARLAPSLHPKTDVKCLKLWFTWYTPAKDVLLEQMGMSVKGGAPLLAAVPVPDDFVEQKPPPPLAVVVCNYEAEEETQLSLGMGAEVHVLEKSNNDWWFVSVDEERTRIGFFPKRFLRLIQSTKPSASQDDDDDDDESDPMWIAPERTPPRSRKITMGKKEDALRRCFSPPKRRDSGSSSSPLRQSRMQAAARQPGSPRGDRPLAHPLAVANDGVVVLERSVRPLRRSASPLPGRKMSVCTAKLPPTSAGDIMETQTIEQEERNVCWEDLKDAWLSSGIRRPCRRHRKFRMCVAPCWASPRSWPPAARPSPPSPVPVASVPQRRTPPVLPPAASQCDAPAAAEALRPLPLQPGQHPKPGAVSPLSQQPRRKPKPPPPPLPPARQSTDPIAISRSSPRAQTRSAIVTSASFLEVPPPRQARTPPRDAEDAELLDLPPPPTQEAPTPPSRAPAGARQTPLHSLSVPLPSPRQMYPAPKPPSPRPAEPARAGPPQVPPPPVPRAAALQHSASESSMESRTAQLARQVAPVLMSLPAAPRPPAPGGAAEPSAELNAGASTVHKKSRSCIFGSQQAEAERAAGGAEAPAGAGTGWKRPRPVGPAREREEDARPAGVAGTTPPMLRESRFAMTAPGAFYRQPPPKPPSTQQPEDRSATRNSFIAGHQRSVSKTR
eukprot:m51a1_g5388 putative myotubularin isoform x2 (3422) ;mRNA; f:19358-31913